jgi:Ran GTPase-activating protein (RanGAP) involved in mRNA processing and transport
LVQDLGGRQDDHAANDLEGSQEVVDKVRLPAAVRLSRSFWDDARNGTAAEKLHFVFRQLTALTAESRITTFELPSCAMEEQVAERLAGVLVQCPALAHLDLFDNEIGAGGAGKLGVLGQCASLAHSISEAMI